MNSLNKGADRRERPCTTPQRIKLIQSIKKSIHRSIQKINPADYKNILKGEYLYMHLCYKGQIINSQYTKVALFLGAVVLKKASEKVSVVITNQSSNKIVKKLVSMGKPILSVLWLQACFQQKRKVPYQQFFFQQQAYDHQNDDEKQQQSSVNFDPLIDMYKSKFSFISHQFARTNNTKFLRFIDKKQKVDMQKDNIIDIRQINIGKYLPQYNQRRKSQTITQKNPKKKVNKKVQFKSEGSIKQNIGNKSKNLIIKKTESNSQFAYGEIKQQSIQDEQKKESKQNSQRLNKSIYEKYLKDYKKYEQEVKSVEQPPEVKSVINFEQFETPCFMGHNQDNKVHEYTSNIKTPSRPTYEEDDQIFQTYSIKKKSNKIRFNITNPLIAQRVSKLNQTRQNQDLPLIQIAGNDSRNLIWVLNKDSIADIILALTSKPKIIVNQAIVDALEKQPLLEITEDLLKIYQVKCRLNSSYIEGKKIAVIDSLFGIQLLSKIINQCKGHIISKNDYLLQKTDFVITNKKDFTKSFRETGKILIQAKFLQNLIQFYK